MKFIRKLERLNNKLNRQYWKEIKKGKILSEVFQIIMYLSMIVILIFGFISVNEYPKLKEMFIILGISLGCFFFSYGILKCIIDIYRKRKWKKYKKENKK